MAEAQHKAVFCTNLELPAGVHDFEASDTKTKAPDADPIKRVIYMDDPSDLGAEIDFVVDGVKTTITKTCFIHIPAGVKHGGLCFRKIDRPVFQIAMSRMPAYSSVPPT